jgi:tripartite-type tricarboxylate transporter receptor subunit TctC
MSDQGLTGFAGAKRVVLLAPAMTPNPIVDKIHADVVAALNAALGDGEVKKRLATEGAEPLPSSPGQYAADIASEQTKWSAIIRKAGVKGE